MSTLKIGRIILGIASTNCYYVYHEGDEETVVFDPADRGDYIFDKLSENGLKVAGIVLTHGHFDHIFGVNKLRELSGAKVYACVDEKELCEDAYLNVSAEVGREYTVSADEYLEDGDEIALAGLNFRVLATPGHTAGSACYYLADEGVLLSGDTLFEESVGRSDLPTGDAYTLTRSIREKLFVLPDETKVFPGHGEPTSIAHEKQYNPYS
jgi:glyoxylase-like metal-dependent hydrolase (beta-lactamase superfamily II)